MSANELIAIELQLKGYDGVMSDFRSLDQMLNGFRGRKNKIEIESDLSKTKKEIIALQGELNKLNSTKLRLDEQGKSSEGLNNKIKETRERLRDATQAAREFQYALKNLSSMSFKQAFSKISSAVAHMGSAMQSAGNALTRLTNPFANFTKGIVMGAGYKALNKFTEGLTNGFNRYDTMKKYPRIMAAFGYSAEESQKSIEALDKSVRGLPTGLDEMVDLAQRFIATTGDMDKGTKLAIATNNAFLASMATDTQRYQGMMQLQDVLGGKDMTAREWNSLVSSMTPAIVKMGESLGYTNKNMDEWIQKVRDGKVSNEDFVDTLIKIGNEGGVLEAMAQESKNTWQAFFANVGNAASRMTAGIITSLDEIVKAFNLVDDNGLPIESVNQLLAGKMIPAIDDMTASIKGWIHAHPEEITEFFKSLKQIDFQGLVQGFGEALLGVGGLIERIANFLNGKDLSWIGKGMLYGNVLGNFLTISGGLLKGSRHIIGGLGAGGYKLFKGIKGIKKYGFMGWLGRVMSVGEDAEKGKQAIDTATKTAPKMGKFMTGLSNVFRGWGQIATMVGGTALVGWGTFKAFKSMFKDLGEIAEISKGIDWSVASADLVAMGAFLTAFIGVGTKVGTALGVKGLIGGGIFAGLTAMFAGTFWADMAMIKRGFKAISEAVGYIKEAEEGLDGLSMISNVPEIKKKAQQAVAVFNAITDILQLSRNNPITGEATNGLKELDKKSAETIKNVTESIGHIKESIASLNSIGKMKLDTGNLGYNMLGMQDALNAISTTVLDAPPMFRDGTAASYAQKMSTSLGNFKTAFSAIGGKGGILSQLPQIVHQMGEIDKGGVLTDLPGRMQDIGQILTDMSTSLQGIGTGDAFASSADSFRVGLKSLKFAIMHLNEIGGIEIDKDLPSKISGIVTDIQNSFSHDQVAGISETISMFKTSISEALKSFEDLSKPIELDITFKLSNGFYSSKRKVISEIKDAKAEIKDQKGGISYSIPVSVFFNVVTNAASALAKITRERQALMRASGGGELITPHISTGGQVNRQGVLYRSGGGSVFKPRGTDKIPAMLTEGEYVQKKQAVDFFGLDFMRKVNNMDVRGAMNALLTKAGTSVGVGRQSIVNNTVNNNQRITQNINTNNPNFAGVRIGRFVGAL